jgi:hypothetical protein
VSAAQILDVLIANAPLIIAILGGLGALAGAAALIRKAVRSARDAAKASPNKVDDVLVDLLDDPLLALAEMVERGDLPGAKVKIEKIRALHEQAKAGKPLLGPLPAKKADPR